MSEAAAEGCETCNTSGFVEEDGTAAIIGNEDNEQEQVAHVQITPQRSLVEALDQQIRTSSRFRSLCQTMPAGWNAVQQLRKEGVFENTSRACSRFAANR